VAAAPAPGDAHEALVCRLNEAQAAPASYVAILAWYRRHRVAPRTLRRANLPALHLARVQELRRDWRAFLRAARRGNLVRRLRESAGQ
jgi:hypothetical protein